MSTPNSYYANTIAAFRGESVTSVIGRVAEASPFADTPAQKSAWLAQIPILKQAIAGLDGHLFLEYVVPRLGSRIDAVIIANAAIVVVEFKVGDSKFHRADIEQVWDYALDLKNFHQASHDAPIIPVLIATEASKTETKLSRPFADTVYAPVRVNADGLGNIVRLACELEGIRINSTAWGRAPYQPTPTIIEAARALYSQHSVESIARNDAGAKNLARTVGAVDRIVASSHASRRKSIVFVTGVPGAGKTLVGLDIATRRIDETSKTHAVFLSGNGPLVAVLREALTRDEYYRRRAKGERVRKGEIAQKVKAFIQNVHHYRDEGLRIPDAPHDHIVIFDEAQRAWNTKMTADFMNRKKGITGFEMSEPEFLISVLDRHKDWSTVICLVGGGQEINRGEAGIGAWLDAVRERFGKWDVHISPELTDSEYAAGTALRALAGHKHVNRDADLHLAVSMRSFRAEHVSAFVKAVLDQEISEARNKLKCVIGKYPIALTRSLATAKDWIRERARGTERFGMVASSAAYRLKPHAVDVRVDVNPIHWFLNDRTDVRSSYYLEDAATEFQVQGLELDWVCVNWDADLRMTPDGWSHHSFQGAKWQRMKVPERRQHLLNAYRVLLTRARQGMVIFVPEGDRRDHTRPAAYYDETFDYLRKIGVPVLEG